MQNASYWNLICRENFELAYTEQIEDIYFLLVKSVTDAKTLKNKKSIRIPTTPAQKIGLAGRAYDVDDILKFNPLVSVL